MKGEKYVQSLIDIAKSGKNIRKEQLKGLSDEELHTLINNIISGGITCKAAAYTAMKNHI
jgi:hypothetical protein